MTATNENFFDSIDVALTPEQAAQAFALAEQGDTGGKPDAGGAPTTTAATDSTSTTTATPTDNEQAKPADAGKTTTGAEGAGSKDGAEVIDPANAVVLARQAHHPLRPTGEGPPGRTALEGLTGKMPTIENAIAGAKRQSKPTMPIVRADEDRLRVNQAVSAPASTFRTGSRSVPPPLRRSGCAHRARG